MKMAAFPYTTSIIGGCMQGLSKSQRSAVAMMMLARAGLNPDDQFASKRQRNAYRAQIKTMAKRGTEAVLDLLENGDAVMPTKRSRKPKQPTTEDPADCLHCDKPCRLTDGKEIYPHRPDLHDKPIYVCDPCGARVGCHPGTCTPLGKAANAETRSIRMAVHARIDPFWKNKNGAHVHRRTVYRFLQNKLGLSEKECHAGQFDVARCKAALEALEGVTIYDLKNFEGELMPHPRKSRKNDAAVIVGKDFCPVEAARDEVPW